MHIITVKIHDAPPLDVGEPDALASNERIQAGGRQRLVQEMLAVGIDERTRFGVQVFGFPRAAQRREVDIAFGCEIGSQCG